MGSDKTRMDLGITKEVRSKLHQPGKRGRAYRILGKLVQQLVRMNVLDVRVVDTDPDMVLPLEALGYATNATVDRLGVVHYIAVPKRGR